MAKPWTCQLINPQRGITGQINQAFNFVLGDLDKWLEDDFVRMLVYGGDNIQGIAQTDFYSFISSPEGLSELGIESSEPPRLLEAYLASLSVKREGRGLSIRFGDMAILKLYTPHPASGTGRLNIESWLEWIIDGIPVLDAGFVPREKLTESAQKRIRISSAPGGLMLPAGALGSSGSWRFPHRYADYEQQWLSTNLPNIQKALVAQLSIFLSKRLR